MGMVGSGYLGSDSLKTSIANEELVPDKPKDWTMGYAMYKFSFMNDSDCTVTINNGSSIFLRAGQGFSMNEVDVRIRSFIIHEEGITYNWVGAY